jgi:hypothetical protein
VSNEVAVLSTIKGIYTKRQLAVVALCKYYAKIVINDFKSEQENNKYWTNRSHFAKDTMFTKSFIDDDAIGFFMAHTMEYGPYLELANDGRHAAIKPTLEKFIPSFYKDLKKIYGQ